MTAHVLFVDDEQSNLIVFEALCSSDFDVLTASSAAEAVEQLRKHEVGVVLSDQRMPGVTGVELLERIRTEFPDAVRMLVTAYADMAATIDAINRGQVRRYLRKPWDAQELKAALVEAMDLYQTRRGIRALERRLIETERVYGLGVVASSLAHELRSPVGSVTKQIEAAREKLRTILDSSPSQPIENAALRTRLAEADEALVDAVAAADKVIGLIRGIELPSRPRAEDDDIDLAHLVRLTLRILGGELRDAAEVRVELGPVPSVRGSRAKLGQVVINLVVNAVQAVSGHPRLENSISVRLRAEGAWVLLEVEDNAPGGRPAELARAFDPFFSSSKHFGGSGLGLAISKRIVEELGGRLEAEARPTRGTVFKLSLPRAGETTRR